MATVIAEDGTEYEVLEISSASGTSVFSSNDIVPFINNSTKQAKFIKFDDLGRGILSKMLGHGVFTSVGIGAPVGFGDMTALDLFRITALRNEQLPDGDKLYFRIFRSDAAVIDDPLYYIGVGYGVPGDEHFYTVMSFSPVNNNVKILSDLTVKNIKSNTFIQIGEYDGDPHKGMFKVDSEGNLLKSNAEETEWVAVGGSGEGTVTSVNTVPPVDGDVTLTADDIEPGDTNKYFTTTKETELTTATSNIATLNGSVTTLASSVAALVESVEEIDTTLDELTFDDLSDGDINKAYTATEKTKLTGIATGATAYTDDQAIAASLSGVTIVNALYANGDSIKTAIGKLQGQIINLVVAGVKEVPVGPYTVVADDMNMLLIFNNASNTDVTLPAAITDTNFTFPYLNLGSGEINFVKQGTDGITGNTMAAQGATGQVRRYTSTSWALSGGTKLEAISKEKLIEAPVNNTFGYDISLSLENNFTITTIAAFHGGNGTCTVTPKAVVGGVEQTIGTSAPITMTGGVAPLPDPFIVTANSNNVLNMGDRLKFGLSIGSSTVKDLMVQCIGYRKTNVW